MTYYRVCRVRCKRCEDVLEYINKTKEFTSFRMTTCSCGMVSLDPAVAMYRIVLGEGGTWGDVEDLSEEWID